jgi:membrane protein DedA with SNARE-associated domain
MILAMQFMIGLRTVGYVTLGISDVSYVRFSILNGISVLVWCIIVTTAGYFFGHAVEAILGDIEHLELPLLVSIGVLGLIAVLLEKRPTIKNTIERGAIR